MTLPHTPDDAGSHRRTRPVQGDGSRYEALLEVLEQQARNAEEEVRASGRSGHGGSRAAQKVVLVLLVLVTAWLWLLPPAWLIPAPPPAPPVAEEEAALRYGMYLQAQRIESYRLEHGALPIALEEAGQPLPGVSYVLVRPGVYELTGTTARVRVTYRSDQPLREWVGAGAGVVDERRLP